MTGPTDETRPALPLEDVARAVRELAAQRELAPLLARFLEMIRSWAAPSAVLAAVRDPAAESGWRLLSSLSAGSGPLGADRSLRQLVEEVPEGLERPTLVRPKGEVPGVRVRENCIVPWTYEGESGILVLRGLPPPCAPNLAEAVALLSTAVWPRLLGGPASRVEAGMAELRLLAQRLQDDATRQIERLQAARLPSAEPPAEAPAAASRLAELEQELETARREARDATAARDELRRRLIALDTAQRESEAAARSADGVLTTIRRELAEARQEAQRSALELEDVRERAGALENALREAQAKTEGAPVAEELEKQRRAADEAVTEARRELAEARQEGQNTTLLVGRLEERVGVLEKALREAEADRDHARGEVERLSSRLESLRSDLAAATERLEAGRHEVEDLRRGADEARATARTAEEALAAARERGGPPTPAEGTREEGPSPRPDAAIGALRSALAVLRRTPFVPPGLRVSIQEARELVETKDERAAPWLRVVLLDRDAPSLEPLADELEAAGLEVRIANYPEELALLMKTPDARSVNAVVCDVLAFRPDQNVAGLFRSWQKDRPSLAMLLSFGADNPTETERAQRVPLSLTAGRLRRPLRREELVEMLTPLARREGAS